MSVSQCCLWNADSVSFSFKHHWLLCLSGYISNVITVQIRQFPNSVVCWGPAFACIATLTASNYSSTKSFFVCLYTFRFEDILVVVAKPPQIGAAVGPRVGGGRPPNCERPFSNLAHFRTYGDVELSCVWWPPRTAFEDKKKQRQNIMCVHAIIMILQLARPWHRSHSRLHRAFCISIFYDMISSAHRGDSVRPFKVVQRHQLWHRRTRCSAIPERPRSRVH